MNSKIEDKYSELYSCNGGNCVIVTCYIQFSWHDASTSRMFLENIASCKPHLVAETNVDLAVRIGCNEQKNYE